MSVSSPKEYQDLTAKVVTFISLERVENSDSTDLADFHAVAQYTIHAY